MQEQLSQKQQALRAGIQMSDARRKRHSEEDSPGLVLQYELILGFLQKIGPALAEYAYAIPRVLENFLDAGPRRVLAPGTDD